MAEHLASIAENGGWSRSRGLSRPRVDHRISPMAPDQQRDREGDDGAEDREPRDPEERLAIDAVRQHPERTQGREQTDARQMQGRRDEPPTFGSGPGFLLRTGPLGFPWKQRLRRRIVPPAPSIFHRHRAPHPSARRAPRPTVHPTAPRPVPRSREHPGDRTDTGGARNGDPVNTKATPEGGASQGRSICERRAWGLRSPSSERAARFDLRRPGCAPPSEPVVSARDPYPRYRPHDERHHIRST